jgi:curved DNA-binding protein CbpA
MLLNENTSYYELLEVPPDASPQELRAAYLRAKAAYKKDSVALYTLMSPNETEEILRRIEEAYEVLSVPERRRAYDRNHGHLTIDEEAMRIPMPSRHHKIISIDRVPPMENSANDADLLIPPTTDFSESTTPPPTPSTPTSQSRAQQTANPRHSTETANEQAITQEIQQETEWRGSFLRRMRETRRISIEEFSEHTKISKTYLRAIEDEIYAKLPAPVYLRGFLTQIAKLLKLPADKVAGAYMARYNQDRAEKQ